MTHTLYSLTWPDCFFLIFVWEREILTPHKRLHDVAIKIIIDGNLTVLGHIHILVAKVIDGKNIGRSSFIHQIHQFFLPPKFLCYMVANRIHYQHLNFQV